MHMQENSKKDRPYNKDGNKQFKPRGPRQDFFIPGNPRGVKVHDGSPIALEKSLRYLKRQIKDTDIMGQYKANQEFLKPSAIKRRKMKDAKYKQRLRDKISAEFWKDHCWLVPPDKNYGPILPD